MGQEISSVVAELALARVFLLSGGVRQAGPAPFSGILRGLQVNISEVALESLSSRSAQRLRVAVCVVECAVDGAFIGNGSCCLV